MTPTVKNVQLMLRESNAIEGVFDKQSLADAHAAWKYVIIYDTMNTQLIRHTHKMLMKHKDIEGKYKGNWRDVPVWIGGKKKSDPPLVIDNKVGLLCQKILKKGSDPVKLHVEFENIHPFIDGNGRIGRILMNWHAIKNGDGKLIVYTDADKQNYYKLFQTSRTSFSDLLGDVRAQNFKDL